MWMLRFVVVGVCFQASERCHGMALSAYMLKPVQRIPSYRLLLIGEWSLQLATTVIKHFYFVACNKLSSSFLGIVLERQGPHISSKQSYLWEIGAGSFLSHTNLSLDVLVPLHLQYDFQVEKLLQAIYVENISSLETQEQSVRVEWKKKNQNKILCMLSSL